MALPIVVVTYPPNPDGRELLARGLAGLARVTFLKDLPPADRPGALEEADVLLSWFPEREIPPDAYARLGRARLLQLVSAGADGTPFHKLPAGLPVAANTGAYAEPMAEHVLAMLLAACKRLRSQQEAMRRGEFEQFAGNRALRGAAVAILGYGGIGRAVARLLAPFDARVLALNKTGRTEDEVAFCGTLAGLEAVLREADAAVICLPLTKATDGLIGARELGWMKPGAVLVNVARGEIVRQEDLYRHLAAHPEFTAALDVWWDEPFAGRRFHADFPFLELPNVLATAHNSGIVPGALAEGARRALENVVRFLRGEAPSGIVRPEDYL